MSNETKRNQNLVIAVVRNDRSPSGDRRPAAPARGEREVATAWLTAGLLLLALTGLLVLLPSPAELLALSGHGAAAVDAAVLAGAALLVWFLTGWVAIVVTVAAFGALPGAGGRHARRLLGLIAPRLALRLVAVAVGASALAGTTACSAPIFASSTAPAASSAVTVTPSPLVDGSATTSDDAPSFGPTPAAESTVVIDIDWPSTTGPTPATTSAGVPAAVQPDPTSAAASTPAPTTASSTSTPTAATTAVDTTTPATAPASTPTASSTVSEAPAGTAGSLTDTPTPRPEAVTRPSGEPVVVEPGDTLWALAADTLPGGADDAAIDAAWRQWYALNRDVIGSDPDLLQPGQHLVPPAPTSATPTLDPPAHDSPTHDSPTADQENDR